jgi:hypothetical protein
LKIEDGIRWISLRKEVLLGRHLNNSPPQASVHQEGGDIECGFLQFYHRNGFFLGTLRRMIAA